MRTTSESRWRKAARESREAWRAYRDAESGSPEARAALDAYINALARERRAVETMSAVETMKAETKARLRDARLTR